MNSPARLDINLIRAVRQKARAAIRSGLQKERMWQADDTYNCWLRGQVRLGRSLSTVHLRNLLGADDYTAATSCGRDQILNGRLAESAPTLLAFGYTMGQGICAAIKGEPGESESAGVNSAIFNFGVALFDFLLDSPKHRKLLHEHWDSAALNSLSRDPTAPERFLAQANAVTCVELRVLLKVIGAFFIKLHERHSTSLALNTDDQVLGLLARAYEAEMRSTRSDLASSAKLSTSADKSKLPFMIIGALARGHAGIDRKNPSDFDLDLFLSALGTAFWFVDDLADMVIDSRRRALNSLLARAELEANYAFEDSAEILKWLMASNAIDEAGQYACDHAALACRLLHEVSSRGVAVQSLRDAIENYVRSWIQ